MSLDRGFFASLLHFLHSSLTKAELTMAVLRWEVNRALPSPKVATAASPRNGCLLGDKMLFCTQVYLAPTYPFSYPI